MLAKAVSVAADLLQESLTTSKNTVTWKEFLNRSAHTTPPPCAYPPPPSSPPPPPYNQASPYFRHEEEEEKRPSSERTRELPQWKVYRYVPKQHRRSGAPPAAPFASPTALPTAPPKPPLRPKAHWRPAATTKKRKAKINQRLRTAVWEQFNGQNFSAPCYSCNLLQLTVFDFEAGHVVAEARGGPATLANLRPICRKCNSSMGTRDMRRFAYDSGFVDARIYAEALSAGGISPMRS